MCEYLCNDDWWIGNPRAEVKFKWLHVYCELAMYDHRLRSTVTLLGAHKTQYTHREIRINAVTVSHARRYHKVNLGCIKIFPFCNTNFLEKFPSNSSGHQVPCKCFCLLCTSPLWFRPCIIAVFFVLRWPQKKTHFKDFTPKIENNCCSDAA